METPIRSREGDSLVNLITGLREDVRELVHDEVQLAKTEISEKLSRFGKNAVTLAIGGVAALLGVVFLLLSVAFIITYAFEVLGLSTVISLFLGYLVIAVIALAIGGALVAKAISTFSKESLVPEKTVETLREIKEGGLEQVPIKVTSAKTPAESSRSSEEIRADVERTRSRIGRDVRGLRTQLSFGRLAARVVNRVANNPARSVVVGLSTGLVGFVIMRVARLFGRKHAA